MNDSGLLSRWRSSAPSLLSVLRIVAAFLFMQPGTAKLFALPAAIMPGGGTVPVVSLLGLAAILEAFGGFLLLVGLFTRPVAFVLSGEMAVAYFWGHAPQSFWTVLNQGMPAVLFCFLWLYMSAAGPGPWSIDARIARSKHNNWGAVAKGRLTRLLSILCSPKRPSSVHYRSTPIRREP